MSKLFAKETDLVAAFCACLGRSRWGGRSGGTPLGEGWTQYHETAGWDVLLAHESGMQVGIEAKLSLNAKVLAQALPGRHWRETGPDYRAVLVPADACQDHMTLLAGFLGITVLKVRAEADYQFVDGQYVEVTEFRCSASLPAQVSNFNDEQWHPWLPAQRETLPDYVPDVLGGEASPRSLTPWKVKAIKLMILLERRGVVHRSDMRALDISPTRWTDRSSGYLDATPNGYVAGALTPNLRAQHPRNWSEIEADFDSWNPYAKVEDAA